MPRTRKQILDERAKKYADTNGALFGDSYFAISLAFQRGYRAAMSDARKVVNGQTKAKWKLSMLLRFLRPLR